MHYAHPFFFSTLAFVHPSLESSCSPPCNNLRTLCIKSSIPGNDWNKTDVVLGGWFVKYKATNYSQESLPPKKTFTGRGGWVFTGTNKTFMRCDGQIQAWDLWLWHVLLIRRDTLRKRWKGEIDEEEEWMVKVRRRGKNVQNGNKLEETRRCGDCWIAFIYCHYLMSNKRIVRAVRCFHSTFQ